MKVRISLLTLKIIPLAITTVMMVPTTLKAQGIFQSLSNHADGNYGNGQGSSKKKLDNDPNSQQAQPVVKDNNKKKEEIKNNESNEIEPHINFGQIAFSISPTFMTIHGTQAMNNSKGVLNSEFYPTVRASYIHFYDKWRFVAYFGYRKITFQQSNERVLWNPTQQIINADFFITRRFGRFAFGFGAGQEGRIFYQSLNSTDISVERRVEKRVWFSPEYEFYRSEKNRGRLALRLGFNPSQETTTYDVKRGTFYSALVKIDHDYSTGKRVGIEAFYKHNNYKTNQLKLDSTEMGLGLSFSFDIGVGI